MPILSFASLQIMSYICYKDKGVLCLFNKKFTAILLSVLILLSSVIFPQASVKADATNGWQKNSTTWSYYKEGIKVNGWLSSGGSWYYLNSSGTMLTGWLSDGDSWYYLKSNGAMATGWISDGGLWYYLNSNGKMTANIWITWVGKQYYLYPNGSMAVSTTTADGWVVGTDGAWDGKGKVAATYDSEYLEQVENAIITLCNQERVNAGRGTLTFNSLLRQVARYKSNQMLQYKYFAHTSPVDGLAPMPLAISMGWSGTAFGENLWMMTAQGYSYTSFKALITASKIVDDWMNSPGHKANILNSGYNKVGVGVVCTSSGKVYATQEFSN